MKSVPIMANPHEYGRASERGRDRSSMCWYRAVLAVALLAMLGAGAVAHAQMPPGTGTGNNGGQGSMGRGGGFGRPSMSPLSNGDDTYDPVMAERRMRALNAERQKQMVADANKLLKLARELNDEVASANQSAFSPDQLRKIAEIEKLAKNVRERMSAGIGETQSQFPPPNVTYPVR